MSTSDLGTEETYPPLVGTIELLMMGAVCILVGCALIFEDHPIVGVLAFILGGFFALGTVVAVGVRAGIRES